MPTPDLPTDIREFIAQFVRSVEQLEILLLFVRAPDAIWSVQRVYDAILSNRQSVERWLEDLVQNGLLEKIGEPTEGYRCCRDENLLSKAAMLSEIYRTTPVRVIEAIYQRESGAVQSFADAFRIKKPKKPADEEEGK